MSLRKAVRHYDRCLCATRRYINAQSAENTSTDGIKMSFSQLKVMSINHSKILSQLRDYINKSIENGNAYNLRKEWVALLHKASSVHRVSSIPTKDLEGECSGNIKLDVEEQAKEKNIIKDAVERTQKTTQSYIPQVFNELKQKINAKSVAESSEEVVSKWKPKKDVVSQTSIASRTRHVISSLASAESNSSRLTRLEMLTNHIRQYPESRYLAVKGDAIGLLLRLRHETQSKEMLAALREGLTVLGYVDPLPGRGIRILSIDGGGVRGLLVIEMLRRLEALTGKRVYELFDFICGVSTGAILMAIIAAHKKSLDDASFLYKELSKKIFTQNAFLGTSNLVWTHAYYNTVTWEELLKKYVGEGDMIKTARDSDIPKLAAVSAVVNQIRVKAFVFRNYSLPYKVQSQYAGSNEYKLWEAARASAAAPSYFQEFRLDEFLHQDGGILTNNPCALAIHEAKHLWPGSPLQCVVSLGTGRCHPSLHTPEEPKTNGASSWRTKFMKILDSATDTEAVHTMLNDLLPRETYFRFNPYLTEMITMDEIRPAKISQLEMDAEMYYRRNEENFENVAKALTAPSSLIQHCKNWIHLQRELLGMK